MKELRGVVESSKLRLLYELSVGLVQNELQTKLRKREKSRRKLAVNREVCLAFATLRLPKRSSRCYVDFKPKKMFVYKELSSSCFGLATKHALKEIE